MGQQEGSEEGLRPVRSDVIVDDQGTSTPSEERALERGDGFVFGICRQCKLPIRYPTIKFPISCSEVVAAGTVATYQVEYCDMHVSCALKYLIESTGSKFISFKTSVVFTRPVYERLFKRFIKSVTSSFEINSIRRS